MAQRDGADGDGTTTVSNMSYNMTSLYDANDRTLEIDIDIIGRWDVELGDTLSGWVRVYDVYMQATIENKFDSDQAADASENAIQSLEYVYCGNDGYSKTYNGGSGVATLPHEIHRDLLKRFTDFDYADGVMTGWSDLNTARSGWTCHWWLLEERTLKSILEQIQYEGCFIFTTKPDGGRYIWVEDSYTNTDIVQTLTESDYSDISIRTSSLADLTTYFYYNYQRHPANYNYIENAVYSNSTARTKWKVGTNENKVQQNLDFITADKVYSVLSHSNPNDCVALYYDNILANPKIEVECTIINMRKSNVEVGDIVTFNDADLTPFGKTWGSGDNSLFFMITEVRRSPGSVEIVAREVYDNLS